MRRVLGIRDFRLYWVGQATSLLGDNFHFIAAPWLVLQLTGDPLILGAVMALGGVPRAVFTLVGGAITDRFSPRIVMITSDIIRFLLTTMLAALVITGAIQVWMMYLVALIFGVVSGFFMPASMSMLPRLVEGDDPAAGKCAGAGH
ncbi:MAG: MFS transporter [Anaerolineales bacterium]|nr:MFS transporter [Anaerolineales bacterium]